MPLGLLPGGYYPTTAAAVNNTGCFFGGSYTGGDGGGSYGPFVSFPPPTSIVRDLLKNK
jgi:hypothetical protein